MADANPSPQVYPAAAAAVAAAGVESLVAVRDRLFHTLFIRFTLLYARTVSPFMRRMIETLLLLKGIACLILLLYIHMFFMRNPLDCLDHFKGLVPRDGILRVEIIKDAPENYTLKDSYDKEKHVHTLQRKADLAVLGVFMSDRNLDMYDYDYNDDKNSEEKETEYENQIILQDSWERSKDNAESHEKTKFENITNDDSQNRTYQDPEFKEESDEMRHQETDHDVELKPEDESQDSELSEKSKTSAAMAEDAYIVEYSLEYGFLRLSQATRERLNISVNLVILDPNKHSCFRDAFSKMIMENFMGYEDVLMGSIKSLAEHDGSKGYLRNVVSGSHYHFVTKWTSTTSYMTATLVMIVFTMTVTVLLRFSQQQIFIFIIEILQLFEVNTTPAFPGAPLLTVILALVGMEAIMSEFFEDTTTAFYVIITVWMADQYDTICSHTPITKKYWLRFFYLYHFFFYAYQYRFGGQFTGLAIFIMWFFTHHSMLYFFHHYEMPYILQNYQLLELTPRVSQRAGAPAAQARYTFVRNLNPSGNQNGTNNVTFRINSSAFPAPEVRRRFGGVRFAGFHFRLDIPAGQNPGTSPPETRATSTESSVSTDTPAPSGSNLNTEATIPDPDIQVASGSDVQLEPDLSNGAEGDQNLEISENSPSTVPANVKTLPVLDDTITQQTEDDVTVSDPPSRSNDELFDSVPLD